MKILWLSHMLPFPPQGGGMLQRSANLLKTVANAHDVTLLAFNQKDILKLYDEDIDKSFAAAVKTMESMCKSVFVEDIECDNKYKGKLRLALSSLFSRLPYSIRWLESKRYRKKLEEIIRNNEFDTIWFDTISLAQYIYDSKMNKSLTILNHHNIESDMMYRRAEKENNYLKKIYYYIEAYKLGRYEKKLIDKFDVNVTCSDLDLKRLNELVPDTKAMVIPNGVNIEFFSPAEDVISKPYNLVFIGGMSWYPNREAMLYFSREIWPLLRKEIPDVHMHVVGEGPPEELIQLANIDQHYHVYGFVDDVKKYFNEAGIYVCPISDGGGTKLKILDAMAMGKPIVAHPVACEGIDVVEGENVLFAETPEQYVGNISKLIEDPELRARLSMNNRNLILSKYSYKVIGENLLNLVANKI